MGKTDVTGYLEEEGYAITAHFFHNGELTYHDSDYGDYTGRFRFVYTKPLGKIIKHTRWYTLENAPKWLLTIYDRVMYDQENN